MPVDKRASKELTGLMRAPSQNHWRTQKDIRKSQALPDRSRFYRLADFLKLQLFDWVYHYFKSRFGSKHPFVTYPTGESGIYPLGASHPAGGKVKVSLVADWATRTKTSEEIAKQVGAFDPDYTIHLGDTYYVGTRDEINQNFFDVVQWPLGRLGSFALNGNHEMYARGKAYFKNLLPRLGPREEPGEKFLEQKASFFCLQNDFWRIIGLDTGYKSVGFPILEKIWPFTPKCEFPEPLVKWLTKQLNLSEQNDRRGMILLTHHQYVSAFESSYHKPGEQLAEVFGRERPALWFWGHEHRFALYGKTVNKNGIPAYGRCIGHGGMPVELGKQPDIKDAARFKLVLYDERPNSKAEDMPADIQVGFNGYANLIFEGNQLAIEYRDIEKNLLVAEAWEVETATGKLNGKAITVSELEPPLTKFAGDASLAIRP
ncbi:MAG: metallophosphoesterase [candidate division Zixibacteria bacterium]|nr:metallophosphoesterase [candidate division Zixibacteria bacterium]